MKDPPSFFSHNFPQFTLKRPTRDTKAPQARRFFWSIIKESPKKWEISTSGAKIVRHKKRSGTKISDKRRRCDFFLGLKKMFRKK